MIQPYSHAYYPPMPVLDVSLSCPAEDDWRGSVVAVVDTGADFTVVPLSLLNSLRAPMVRPAVLSSVWQERRPIYIYEVDLRIGQQVLPAVDVAGDPFSNEMLLGRNVLSRLDIRLEGPALRSHFT